MAVESSQLGGLERSGLPSRVEAGTPERLVGDQVPDTRHTLLIEEPRLQRRSAPCERSPQLRDGDGASVRTEPRFLRVELDTTEAAWIAHAQLATAGEADDDTVPALLRAVRRIEKIVDAGDTVDDETPRHAEAEAEHGTGGLDVEEQQLPDTAGGPKPLARERGPQPGAVETAFEIPGIGRLDSSDASVQCPLGEHPVRLHLDEFGHLACLPADFARPLNRRVASAHG